MIKVWSWNVRSEDRKALGKRKGQIRFEVRDEKIGGKRKCEKDDG